MADNNYKSAINNAIEEALAQAGEILVDHAAALAPVKTGRLRGSITWKTRNEGSHAEAPAGNEDEVSVPYDDWTLHVGSNVDYAEHQEYGTKRTNKQPFLRPALANNKVAIRRDFSDWVERGLKRGR
jgi:HK97 gp10 family phage protein